MTSLHHKVQSARGMLDDDAAESLHLRMQYLHEVADGAWGDNPHTRGLAREEIKLLKAKYPDLQSGEER